MMKTPQCPSCEGNSFLDLDSLTNYPIWRCEVCNIAFKINVGNEFRLDSASAYPKNGK